MWILHTPCPFILRSKYILSPSFFTGLWQCLIKSISSHTILLYQLQSLPSLWLDSQCLHFILLHDSSPPNSTAYWKTFFQAFFARFLAIFLGTAHKEVRIMHFCALILSCQTTNWCAVWLCSPFPDSQTHPSTSSHTSARESPLSG